jgi:transcription initiation factor TFIIB
MQLPSTICSLCKSDLTIADPESGEIICNKCGMVISDKTQDSNRPESCDTFDTVEINDRRRRTGNPTPLSRYDMGLSTIIGRINKDSSGNKIDSQTLSTMKRLRTWDLRTQASVDRSRQQAFSKLHILKDKLALSDATVDKSAYIYRKAQEIGLIRGRTIPGIVGSAVYIACRELQIPKTLREIAVAGNIRRRVLSRTYRILTSELDIKMPIIDPIKCIVKVANKASLNEKTKRQAIDVMNKITKREISAGKNPMALAATVLYITCLKTGVNIRQADIAYAAGISEVTLRNRIKDLKDKLNLN